MLSTLKAILPKEEFSRNVLTLVTGTAIAQAIPLAITPLLTRIYTPEQFGIFALFVAIVSSLSTLVTGRYELAIMLPKKDSDAANIAGLAITLNFLLSSLLFLAICVFNERISTLLHNPSISVWLYFIPLSLFINGVYLSLNYWSNRKKFYKLMANRRILESGGTAGIQLGLGVLHASPGGLIIGSLSAQGIAAGVMGKTILKQSPEFIKSISKAKMWALAKRYQSCPKFLVPAHTLSALSIQLPAIFINSTFGLAISGLFMLAERIIGSPISLISTSIGDVFRQQASKSFATHGNCKHDFESTFKKLLLISIPPFVLFCAIAPYLFSVLFGEKWRISGEYAQLMAPMFLLRFITNPLSNVAIISQKNKYELAWQLGLLIALAAVAAFSYYTQVSSKHFIVIFTAVYSVFYLIDLITNYRFACGSQR